MYKFEIDAEKKIFLITAAGMFKIDEAQSFISEYEAKVKTIDPTKYTLLINAKEQKPSAPEVAELQQKAIILYMQTPFKKRLSIVIDSLLTMMQIKRLGNGEELLKAFIFVDSLEEAYAKV